MPNRSENLTLTWKRALRYAKIIPIRRIHEISWNNVAGGGQFTNRDGNSEFEGVIQGERVIENE